MKLTFFLPVVLICLISNVASAQTTLSAAPLSVNKIPNLITLSASATHVYALSESEGLIVFRANTDTLQYILTSEGMSQRGETLVSDVRFAYQFGQDNRLTVLEPTSLLGVYSSTNLPSRPLAVARVSTTLYIAAGSSGLLALPLDSPSSFDTEPARIQIPGTNSSVIDVISVSNTFYSLLGSGAIAEFRIDGNELRYLHSYTSDIPGLIKLHQLGGKLHASSSTGALFTLQSNGESRLMAEFDSPVAKIEPWNEMFVVRTISGRLFIMDRNGVVTPVLNDSNAGNHFAIANSSLWVATYDLLSRYTISSRSRATGAASQSGTFTLQTIPNQVVTFPRAVLVPLTTSGISPDQVRFQISSEVPNAEIRGHGFFWQPGLSQTGIHQFTINAISTTGQTVSQTFLVDVRSFNSPPRFNPTRPLTISVGENFTLPIKAIDPDGVDQDLIRYHGVDLPEGSSISERTGMFSWTPDRRQVGNHEFRVIATDQFGAATSQTVSITVRNLNRN